MPARSPIGYALARKAFEEIGGRGVGAIGMCITGNFALTMALDPHLMTPVLSQPSLPWNPLGIGGGAVHASPDALATIRRRHGEDGLSVIGLRFESDKLCRAARFETLATKLGEAFDGRQLPDDCAANFPEDRHPHSVLTKELIDKPGQRTHQELEDVLAFFETRLR
jgi:dienelactone hydrolase